MTASRLRPCGTKTATGPKELAQRFDTDGVKLDQTVFNAGHVVKAYRDRGQQRRTRRQRAMASIPHRVRRGATMVALEQLQVLVAAPAGRARAGAQDRPHYASAFDLDAFLGRLGIEYTQDATPESRALQTRALPIQRRARAWRPERRPLALACGGCGCCRDSPMGFPRTCSARSRGGG